MRNPIAFIEKDASTVIMVVGEAASPEAAVTQVLQELGMPDKVTWSPALKADYVGKTILVFTLAKPKPIASAGAEGTDRAADDAARGRAVTDASKAFWTKHEATLNEKAAKEPYTPSFSRSKGGAR